MGKRASIAGTIIYALDHCGLAYEKNNKKRLYHALTWFGLLSYNVIAKSEIIKKKKQFHVLLVKKNCMNTNLKLIMMDLVYPPIGICQKEFT